jgi:hypothetical protein
MRIKWGLVFLVITSLGMSIWSGPGASGAKSTSNEAQVEKLVQEAVDLHSQLPSFTPSLSSISTAEGVYAAQGSSLSFKCDPDTSEALAQHPKPCWYGDLAAKKVVVLIGDSNAGNWEPVLNLALKQLKFKLAVFVYPGCSSQLVNEPSAPIASGQNWQWCNLFHAKVVGVVERLHPKAIISAALGEGFSGKTVSFLPFAKNWKKTFDLLTSHSPQTIRILMGATPNNVAGSIPICLSRYVSSSTNAGMAICSPHYYPGRNFSTNPWSYWQRDELSASISDAKLIQTYKWFCGFQSAVEDYCPAVIGNKLVYLDTDHISIAYMDTLDNVVRNALVATGL